VKPSGATCFGMFLLILGIVTVGTPFVVHSLYESDPGGIIFVGMIGVCELVMGPTIMIIFR